MRIYRDYSIRTSTMSKTVVLFMGGYLSMRYLLASISRLDMALIVVFMVVMWLWLREQ